MTVTVSIPMDLPSVANKREFWAVKAKRVKAQRNAVTLALKPTLLREDLVWVSWADGSRVGGVRRVLTNDPLSPLVVTLTRVYAGRCRAYDSDNLVSAFKAVRDSVAACFGVDDADPRIRFVCAQERGAKASKACVRLGFEVKTEAT